MECFTSGVDLFDEFRNATGIVVFDRVELVAALIGDDNLQSCVEEGRLFEAAVDLVKVKFHNVGENGPIGFE